MEHTKNIKMVKNVIDSDIIHIWFVHDNQQLYFILQVTSIDQHIGQYLGFTNISVSAKMAYFIGLGRWWHSAVIFLTPADNLRKKAQWTKSRRLSCSNTRCIYINKQTMHTSAVASETKVSSLIRLIKNHSKLLKLLQFEKN